jgi:hypothetical protein
MDGWIGGKERKEMKGGRKEIIICKKIIIIITESMTE